jgi:hypothetical protein
MTPTTTTAGPARSRNGARRHKKAKPSADSRSSKIFAHPLRREILTVMGDRVMSPTEISAAVGWPLTHTSYHVRQLAEYGVLKLVKTTPRRGAVEHHYRVVLKTVTQSLDPTNLEIAAQACADADDETWAAYDAGTKRGYRDIAQRTIASYLTGQRLG